MMTKYERCKDLPHFDLIRENQPIVIPSIFMFESGVELHAFLYACQEYNCKVFFENEKLIIPPNSDIATKFGVLSHEIIINCREIGDAYVRYLNNLDKMKWVEGEHEPILTEVSK